MIASFDIFRDGVCWFLDGQARSQREENMIVLSTPDSLASGFYDFPEARVTASDYEFAGARKLTLVAAKVAGGVVYTTKTRRGNSIDEWMGAFFWDYFQLAPRELFVTVEKQ